MFGIMENKRISSRAPSNLVSSLERNLPQTLMLSEVCSPSSDMAEQVVFTVIIWKKNFIYFSSHNKILITQ